MPWYRHSLLLQNIDLCWPTLFFQVPGQNYFHSLLLKDFNWSLQQLVFAHGFVINNSAIWFRFSSREEKSFLSGPVLVLIFLWTSKGGFPRWGWRFPCRRGVILVPVTEKSTDWAEGVEERCVPILGSGLTMQKDALETKLMDWARVQISYFKGPR